jgi:energy-converting hydrogenase Eha subunit C
MTVVIAGEPGAKLIGCALLAVAVVIARRCARYLNAAATNRRHAHAAGSA